MAFAVSRYSMLSWTVGEAEKIFLNFHLQWMDGGRMDGWMDLCYSREHVSVL